MSSLGQCTNSFLSATNEYTVALANLNVDFSCIKVEVPKEFVEVGRSLSLSTAAQRSRGRIDRQDSTEVMRSLPRLGALRSASDTSLWLASFGDHQNSWYQSEGHPQGWPIRSLCRSGCYLDLGSCHIRRPLVADSCAFSCSFSISHARSSLERSRGNVDLGRACRRTTEGD